MRELPVPMHHHTKNRLWNTRNTKRECRTTSTDHLTLTQVSHLHLPRPSRLLPSQLSFRLPRSKVRVPQSVLGVVVHRDWQLSHPSHPPLPLPTLLHPGCAQAIEGERTGTDREEEQPASEVHPTGQTRQTRMLVRAGAPFWGPCPLQEPTRDLIISADAVILVPFSPSHLLVHLHAFSWRRNSRRHGSCGVRYIALLPICQRFRVSHWG
jgi:hypothetical protein